jgi:hypothetical protein
MRPTILCGVLSAVLLSTSAWASQLNAPPPARAHVLKENIKVKKVSMSDYRLPTSFTGQRCFEWRIRSRWDLCIR